MNYDALLVIDMQTALIEDGPDSAAVVVARIKDLIAACRAASIPVIYIRHDGGPRDELEPNTPGWQIYQALAPLDGEKIFDKKYNSAFRQTGLHDYLQALSVQKLLLCGMQTEFCFDVSCKVAFELGYTVTIPQGTVTTFSSDFCSGDKLTRYFEDKIWNHRYAEVFPLSDLINQ